MRLDALARRLDDRLRTADFAAVDASANGLQVGAADAEVERAAFAVDSALEPIERAAAAGADVLCVHHGLVWGGLERLTGRTFDRVAALVGNDLGLYVSHLPLDAHPEIGNAAGLADVVGLSDREPFGRLGGPEPLGLVGRLEAGPTPAAALADELEAALPTADGRVRVIGAGPDRLETVAVLTGAGTDALDEAVEAGADALLTGEARGRTYHEAHEAGISVVTAGHYATEVFGVRALEGIVDGWGLETAFIDCPTGL